MNIDHLARHIATASLITSMSAAVAFGQAPKPKQKPAAAAVAPRALLLIKSDLPAVVTLDGESLMPQGGTSGGLAANEIVRRSVPLGEHIIEAVSSDGEDKWREVFNVDKVGQRAVLIELEVLRTARLAKVEQARKTAEEDAAAARRTAEATATAARKEAAARAEREQREADDRAERERQQAARRAMEEASAKLRSRIGELERQVDAHELEATSLSQQAEQAERDAQRYQSQGNNLLAAISATTAAVGRQSAQKHQREAQGARTQAKQLERELAALRQ